jgi:2-octaprenyl-6-methoxyphenol hydroxylase
VTRSCDIAIVGGGLAGASLAIALAPLGHDVKVIEAVAHQADSQPSYDDRTLALSHSTCRILAAIGLWDTLAGQATAIRRIFISELGRPGRLVLDPAELGLTEFGHVVEARSFGAAASVEVQRFGNVEVIAPAKVVGVETGPDAAQLTLEGEDGQLQLAARLVVAADGANSFIREHLKVPTERFDYGQTAVNCNFTPGVAHEGRAFERLTPTGPLAVLPHTQGRCGLVWTVTTGQVREILELDDEAFLARARERFGNDKLGGWSRAGRRSTYPLRLARAREDVRQRLVILGNAAHAIHPIGAQGFNLALRDAATLAEVIADDLGGDPGNAELLYRYSRWRQPDQRGTIATSDGMTRLFAHPSVLAAGLRSGALLAHALSPMLRRRAAIKAMGYRGRIPRLALGEALRRP